MRYRIKARIEACLKLAALAALLTACGGGASSHSEAQQAGASTVVDEQVFLAMAPNDSGVAATYTKAGYIDQSNPFFKPMGNGRTCHSCHQQSDGWSLTPRNVLARFNNGNDPLFLPFDAANSPQADVSTPEARRAAYNMLLTKGVIRIGLPVPSDAEFQLIDVDDPYRYASSAQLSLFRRPLPTANLKYLATVMWDARQTHQEANSSRCIAGTNECYATLQWNLRRQANHAVLAHAQAASELSQEEENQIIDFEQSLFTAQLFDNGAKSLTGQGALGGPFALSKGIFYFGINDEARGDYQTKKAFDPQVFNMYNVWRNASATLVDTDTSADEADAVSTARRSIARGQGLFNSKPIFINNVGGMRNASVRGTCSTCHNAPHAGSSSLPLLLNIGVADGARRSADMPLYTLQNKETGEIIQTTDPGAAMISGKWNDIGRFKVPVLRGLASRPPYFHDGSASDLREVVKFYDERFKIGFSEKDIEDLTAFLKSL